MVIRKATPEDVSACVDIEVQIWPQYRESARHDLDKQAGDDNFIFLVYEEDGKILGFLTVELERWNGTALLQRLEVDKKHRKKGIGSKLVDEIERMAREKKWLALRLYTGTTYLNQQEFYRKRGFTITGTIKDFYIGEKKPEERDAVFMMKKV